MYKGRKKQTICYCAIKRVPKTAKARVLQEVGSESPSQKDASGFQGVDHELSQSRATSMQVRAMTALQHGNVLKFYSWFATPSRFAEGTISCEHGEQSPSGTQTSRFLLHYKCLILKRCNKSARQNSSLYLQV